VEFFAKNIAFLRTQKNLGQQELADKLGFKGRSRISNYESSSSKPGVDDLLLLSKFFDVNIDDLLNRDLSIEQESELKEANSLFPGKILPLIPIDAMAGLAPGDVSVLTLETEKYVVPEFNKTADFLIRISGTSMSPKYFNGDIVACKKIPNESFLQWGKVYVLDTIQGALCKRILPSEKKNHVICRSDNRESYPDFELPWKEVRSLAIVVGTIRLE
jgi:transcriptional regulator with XRE-family HTH domain